MHPIRGVLIDLDGVVRHFPTDNETRQVLAVAFDPPRLRRAITGAITDEEWRDEVARLVPHELRSAVERWKRSTGTVDHEVLSLVSQLRRRVPVGLLTNATTRLNDDLAMLGIADRFDVICNSAVVGVAKPDPLAFTGACASLGMPPEQTLFIDDSKGHVEGAVAIGLQGVIYADPAQLRTFCLTRRLL